MLGFRAQMVLAIVAAVLAGLLVYGISYLVIYLVPDASNQVPTPTPTTSTIDMLFGGLLSVGLAALTAFTIVLIGLFINRIRNKNRLKDKLALDLGKNFYAHSIDIQAVKGHPNASNPSPFEK